MSSSSSEDSDDDEPSAKKKRSDVRGYYHVQPRSKRKSRKFKTSGNVYDVTFMRSHSSLPTDCSTIW